MALAKPGMAGTGWGSRIGPVPSATPCAVSSSRSSTRSFSTRISRCAGDPGANAPTHVPAAKARTWDERWHDLRPDLEPEAGERAVSVPADHGPPVDPAGHQHGSRLGAVPDGAGAPQQIQGAAGRPQIEPGRAYRHQQDIGQQKCRGDPGADLRRQIDHHVVGAGLQRQHAGDPALRIARAAERQALDQDRQPAAGLPVGSAALGVGIDEGDRAVGVAQGAGEVDGDGGLARAALEIADRDKLAHELLPSRMPGCAGLRDAGTGTAGSRALGALGRRQHRGRKLAN